MPTLLADTMSGALAAVAPLEPGHLRMYTCGPTVWRRAHVGNFRTFVFEDVLRRWMERRFDRVTHVMNLTDVDDRIIRNAVAAGHTLEEETAPWIAAFFEDVDTLGIRRAHHYPRATEYIDQMVDLVHRLDERGVTYRADGSVYFHLAAFPEYGRLSGVRAEGLVTGASGRVDADDYVKEDARDFALWKSAGKGEPAWDTALGRGHPGWHLECSAMSMTLLGESFDIHCGGVDNIFPHHENEIAQSEAATGRRFVSIWCHSQPLRIDGEKMAKRLGNDVDIPHLLADGARPSALRYLLAATVHYRKPLNFTDTALGASAEAVDRLVAFRDRVRSLAADAAGSEAAAEHADRALAGFEAAMDDDINLSEAMGPVFTAVREVNRLLDTEAGGVTQRARARLDALLESVDSVLGVFPLVDRERAGDLDGEERDLLDRRAGARARREFALADDLRDQLRRRGVTVEDTPGGQRWRRG